MPKLIEQKFPYGTNSEIPSLWAHMGYIYGTCARQLHYANKYGYNGFTERDLEMMETGKDVHEMVEKWFHNTYPDLVIRNEVKRSINLSINNQLWLIGAKADLIAWMHPNLRRTHRQTLIEIKYLYGRKAYYQTLIEKLVFPDMDVMCFQYGNLNKPQFHSQLLIPLKANLDMARVYAGRMITSLSHMPPRFPNAYYAHPTCAKCIHREICYTETIDDTLSSIVSDLDGWETFKRVSQPAIESIRKQTMLDSEPLKDNETSNKVSPFKDDNNTSDAQ